ncbi:MAG: YhbY family RNA-binding protein [bacterium]
MEKLKGKNRKYLRGLAHNLDPVILIGHEGFTPSIIKAVEKALADHELIKIKFNKFKEEKEELSLELENLTKSEMVGMIGNVAIFYKQNPDKDKRKIVIP